MSKCKYRHWPQNGKKKISIQEALDRIEKQRGYSSNEHHEMKFVNTTSEYNLIQLAEIQSMLRERGY